MDNAQKKFLILVALIFVLVLIGLFYSSSNDFYDSDLHQVTEETTDFLTGGRVVLIFEFGDESRRVLQTHVDEEEKAWSFLQQAAAVSGLALEAGENFMPVRINGRKNGDDGKKWNLYVDNIKSEESPFNIMVKPPVELKFVFE